MHELQELHRMLVDMTILICSSLTMLRVIGHEWAAVWVLIRKNWPGWNEGPDPITSLSNLSLEK
jgi:hypothetical protein